MALRIEKIWNSVFGQTPVRRKEGGEGQSQGQERKQNEKKDEQEPEQRADKQSVEKAVGEMKTNAGFTQAGLNLEMVETRQGLTVRWTNASGTVIRVMSAEEFLKLRDNTVGDTTGRGKILDQKF